MPVMPSDSNGFPRVLIVAQESIDRCGSYAIWTSSLFGSWPRERLAQLVYKTDSAPQDQSIDTRVLGREDLVVLGRIQVWADRVSTLRRAIGVRRAQASEVRGGDTRTEGRAAGADSAFQRVRRAWLDLFPFRLPPSVQSWICKFRPDVIFSPIVPARFMRLTMAAARLQNTPIFAYFYDDWPSVLFRETPFAYVPRRHLLHTFHCIRDRITGVGTASEAMAQEYRNRFHFKSCAAYMRCLDVPASIPQAPRLTQEGCIRLVYIGGLHLDRWKALRELGLALQQLQREGFRSEAVIYAPAKEAEAYREALSIPPVMSVAGFLHPDRIPEAVDAADVVIHVESFSPVARRFTRLSLSTKIPMYMSRGRPILAYGPGEVASCRYVADSAAGVLVGEENRELLLDRVRQLLGDAKGRVAMGQNAWNTARRNHATDVVRERFREAIVAAAQQQDTPAVCD